GREQSPHRRAVRVQDVVREVVRFMSAAPPPRLSLQTDLDETCPAVLGAPDELHQVVTNLCTNAMQAVAERGGTVTLSVRNAELAGSMAAALESAGVDAGTSTPAGRAVQLVV